MTHIRTEHPGRYGRLASDIQLDSDFPRSLYANLPLSRDALSRARIILVVDSTFKPGMLKDYLHSDVLIITMAHSTLNQMAEVLDVIYTPTRAQLQKFSNLTAPVQVIFCNFFDHLACKALLSKLQKAPRNDLDGVASVASAYVADMELVTGTIEGKLKSKAAFVLPPGITTWTARLRDLALMATKIATARNLHLEPIVTTMRVDGESYRPSELSYPAVIADISKYCQTLLEGDCALTICDATCFDHGMEMAQEMFALDGRPVLRDPTMEEMKALWVISGMKKST